MTKELLIDKLENGKYTQEKILSWVKHLPPTTLKAEPIRPMVGDVYYHPIFGHPFVLLEYRIDDWVCGLLTTESECENILCPTESRIFSQQFFTSVVFTIPCTNFDYKFRGIYENKRHLKKVLKSLKQLIK